MELSDVIKSLEDVIAELKEVEYERSNDIITLHLQQNNSELISRCILKQPENSSKTQTWKEFCEEENKRRIKDLEKENERLREEIRENERLREEIRKNERLREKIHKTNNDWYFFHIMNQK